jgi:hypothetical protein
MNAPSPASDTGRGRRLLVTLVIATAAAAVTAGVALKDRRPGEAVVERTASGPALADGSAIPAAPARRSREQPWRDPWKRPAPLPDSVPTSIGEAPDAGASLADPSLPAAAEALKGVAGTSGESAPTF